MIKSFSNEFHMYKNEAPMACQQVEHGIILPRRLVEGGPLWGLGGVCDQENKFVELSAYDGGWAKHGGTYAWTQEEYVDEEVVYFGLFLKHWGHFLVDLLGRIWYLPNLPKHIKIAYVGEECPVGNYLELFELLGITEERLLRIEKPTRFKTVIVPQFASRPCIWYTKEYVSAFDYMARKIEEEGYQPAHLEVSDKIYFSRLGFGKAIQTEFGEELIECWLKHNGYQVISPEKLSLRDQIYIWNHGKEIVCLNGSIPINVLFSKNPDLKLLVLNKTSLVHKNLDLFLLMRNCNVTYLDVYREPFKKYPKSIGEGPFLLGITDDILEYAKTHNMRVPFSKPQMKIAWMKNQLRLVWCIWNIKGKLRMCISNMLSADLKVKIKRLLKRK